MQRRRMPARFFRTYDATNTPMMFSSLIFPHETQSESFNIPTFVIIALICSEDQKIAALNVFSCSATPAFNPSVAFRSK